MHTHIQCTCVVHVELQISVAVQGIMIGKKVVQKMNMVL